MRTLGHIFAFAAVLTVTFLTALFGVHVLLSIANLYSLSFITQFSFVQIYGIWIIISILKFYDKETKESTKSDSPYGKAFIKAASTALYYLIAWGVAFVAFNIIN